MPKITIIDYSAERLEEKEVQNVEESFAFRDTATVTWINIDGHDEAVIRKIDEHFGIHPLVVEDIMDTSQRPKVEDYEDYVFFVLRMIYFEGDRENLCSEQVSLLLGKNFVISFQEDRAGDVFDGVRERLRGAKGRIRRMGADYLAYALMDAIVDYYFVILERLGERMDRLEAETTAEIRPSIPAQIHRFKKDMIFLRRQIWPLREVIGNLRRSEPKLIPPTTRIYLGDLYDNTIQVNETIEALRESAAGMHDVYLSLISNKMSEVMKILTVFTALFIPLTFLAGIYGMNFEFMPELRWRYGYFILLGVMVLISVGMIAFFKRKRWF